jgi:hypothetical protein
MGLEGKSSQYQKLAGADTHELVAEMQSNGISILGSTIIGLEEHTPGNLDEAIEYAVSHNTEFHQFMLYTPVAGTPLFEEHRKNGTLLDPDCEDTSDVHGQLRFAHRHAHIPPGEETKFLLKAFQRDFEVNGPSIMRMARGTLRGYKKYGNHPNPAIRARFQREACTLPHQYSAVLWATRKWYPKGSPMYLEADSILRDLLSTFGLSARIVASIGGRWVFHNLKKEAKRPNPEPPTFYERSADLKVLSPKTPVLQKA